MLEAPAHERWLPVAGHEGEYEVSDQGRVRSIDRTTTYMQRRDGREFPVQRRHKGVLLSPGRMPSGHLVVGIDHGRTRLVHALVLEAFVGPRPHGYDTLHGDGNPTNNALTDLRWGTRAENVADMERHGTRRSAPLLGEASPLAVLRTDDVISIKRQLAAGTKHRIIAAQFGIDRTTVTAISRGKNWAHVQLGASR